MGDTFQIIADVEAAEAEAAALAASIVGWLRDAQIIAGQQPGCVLGADAGYPPGPGYDAAVTDVDELLGGLKVNGLEVTTARSVFFPGQGEVGPVTCPQCGRNVELQSQADGTMTAHWKLFSDAITRWMAKEPNEVACPLCWHPTALNDWHWSVEWPVAVGFLGFTFWNWPPLNSSFIAQVQEHLGHKIVVIRGKL
ncbi:MAG TPA: hypothetical protein VF223_10575 [Trebonia sp.]